MRRTVVAISDYCDGAPPSPSRHHLQDFHRAWGRIDVAPPAGDVQVDVQVVGGYLERLPLAAVAAGLAERAEVWQFAGSDEAAFDSAAALGGTAPDLPAPAGLTRRVFRADGHAAPYGSADALAHIARHGAPDILCVWGLGVTEELLDACEDSIRIYNSIDAPAIRIPPAISRDFDIFLTGAEWQLAEIRARHPGAICAVLPIGPEFASDVTFHPTGAAKDYDVVYVAATQAYKRHDLLLDALDRLPRSIRALCVVGYGEMTDNLRAEAIRRGLNIDWVGPVSHDEVNALINRAKVGVVCGVDDGAPAILTEYMLAGLPVLANERLVCGRQYIRPDTGLTAAEDRFHLALAHLVERHASYDPRAVVQANWTWPHSIRHLSALIEMARSRRAGKVSA
ncbi:glycosyltransferase [Paracoccus sp. Z118]|uniref:glycosyltransferase n=1 Tax=Paracoccus sp. Z118 TaxID=2851017 RepID=UPI001C2C6889|nr:glycosyltransferase [Paracoccus sp. Z118]MBV0892822.1 glycosyltransferase [Paracoccus sp. Z118]